MSKTKNTSSADIDPQPISVGKWTFPALTINTAILLEQIDSPFMRQPKPIIGDDGKTTGYEKVTPSLEEFARTLYVLVNADNPLTLDIISDPIKFRNSVSEMARQISFRELAGITSALNELMANMDKAVTESGVEGDGKKKETGQ